MAVQHRLDLRIHPVFQWHVEEEVICEYLTGIRGGGVINWGGDVEGKEVILMSGALLRRVKNELYQVEGYSSDTIMFNGTAIPKDLHEEVLNIISFAKTLKGASQ